MLLTPASLYCLQCGYQQIEMHRTHFNIPSRHGIIAIYGMAKTHRRAMARGAGFPPAKTSKTRQGEAAGSGPEMHGRDTLDSVEGVSVERTAKAIRSIRHLLATAQEMGRGRHMGTYLAWSA
jgi:hypothetical protein